MPPTKNLTLPAVFTVTEMVVAILLEIVPEIAGAPTLLLSLALVMVIVRVWVSDRDPSETATMRI